MPIYEYQCAACGGVTEKWQNISDAPLTECPACGGSLSKIISSCAFHLKGSGWYVTDYAGNRAASASDKGGDAAKAAGASGESPPSPASDTAAAAPASKIK